MELDIKDLYKLFEDNNLSPKTPVVQEQKQQSNSMIKIGDIVVTEFKGREFKGEVSRVYEKAGNEQFDIKVGETIISVKFENILEHYPKNRRFETTKKEIKPEPKPVVKETVKTVIKKVEPKIVETKVEPKNPENQSPNKIDKEEEPKKVLPDPKKLEKEEERKSPDNAVPIEEKVLDSKKEVKVIGKVVHFSGLKLQEVTDFLMKKGIDKEKCWYMISEKENGEIHVIRNNDKGFKIQPFVLSFMDIQIKDKHLNESSSQIKIKGNNNFSIISEIPNELYDLVRNGLIVLLSK